MGAENRLRAKLNPVQKEGIESLEGALDKDRPEVERVVINEGLDSMGIVEQPTNAQDRFRWFVRKIGLMLGFAGVAFLGFGVFGPRLFSLVGFGLALCGFAFIAAEEFLDLSTNRADEVSVNE